MKIVWRSRVNDCDIYQLNLKIEKVYSICLKRQFSYLLVDRLEQINYWQNQQMRQQIKPLCYQNIILSDTHSKLMLLLN